MLIPVVLLSVGAVVGGFVDIPGVVSAFANWINSAAQPLVEPTTAEDYETSFVAVIAAVIGGFVAWRAFRKGGEIVTTPCGADGLRPQVLLRRALRRPLLAPRAARREPPARAASRSRSCRARSARSAPASGEVAGETARLQSGLLRSYALVVAASVAILVVVFVAVR